MGAHHDGRCPTHAATTAPLVCVCVRVGVGFRARGLSVRHRWRLRLQNRPATYGRGQPCMFHAVQRRNLRPRMGGVMDAQPSGRKVFGARAGAMGIGL